MRSSSLNPFSARKFGAAVVLAVAIVSAAAATASGAVYSGAGARAKATAPANTSPPAISGTPKQNQVLTSSPGAWTGTTPLTYGYQWSRCNTTTALANGHFESNASGWVGINGGSIAQSTAQAHSGSGSLAVVTPGGSANVQGAQYTTAAGSITAGRTYRFLAWVYTGSSVTVSVTIRNFDATGAQLQGSFIPTITSPGWNRLSVRLVAPAGATSEQLQVSVDKTATTFYVDDAFLDDCAPISGATSASYTVQAADAGSTLMSVATATNSAGSASASSDVTAMALDQFDTAPAYTGPIYTNNTAAAGGDPAPPPPITTTLPTWRNTYDWPNGHGYVGWHYATSATDSRYGSDTNHGGNSGLWLWPTGGQQYTPNDAEWTYTAPGTTRISTVNITFAYRNKLLAHHCIEIGLRTLDGRVVSQDRWCQPALPPDSQREVKITLEDPANNPTSKVLFFRLAFPACSDPSSPSCSKYIPQLDPLTVGGYARLEFADMILVDDDNPIIQPSGPLWDIKDHFIDGTQTYGVTLGSTEPGSGIVSSAFSHASTYPPVTDSLGSQNAPCDPAHNTPPLDARICPATFSWDTTVPTPPYPEGPNTFTETATDNAGNVGSLSWTIYIDRTDPDSVIASGDFPNLSGAYINGRSSYGMNIEAHDPGSDEQKASGIARVWVDGGGGDLASSGGQCTDLICTDDFSADFDVDTSSLSEGSNTFTPHASDLVGHVIDGPSWTVLVDRTGPQPATDIAVWSYDGSADEATIGWTEGDDPDLPTGEPGSGVDRAEYRYQVNAGSWSDWTATDDPNADTFTPAFVAPNVNPGDTVGVEVREWDTVGNESDVASASLVVQGDEINPADLPMDDPSNDSVIDRPIFPPVPPNTPDQPLQLTSDDFDVFGLTGIDDILFDPQNQLLSFAGYQGANHERFVSSTAGSTSLDLNADDPCTGPGTSGSSGDVSWVDRSQCVVFTNAQGSWTIYKTCVDVVNHTDSTGTYRRGVGPGYIARLVEGSHVLVDDFRKRYQATDAAYDNVGNVGAQNGGLGTFEVQYTRGVPGQTNGGTVDPATGATLPPRNPDASPRDGFISVRQCAAPDAPWGVFSHQAATAPKKVTLKDGTPAADYDVKVWLGDPWRGAGDENRATALFWIDYRYRFAPNLVSAIYTLHVEPDVTVGPGDALVKEPKYGATLRAAGLFNRISALNPKGEESSTRGQEEGPQAVLYTEQAQNGTRTTGRWDCTNAVCGGSSSNPCPTLCFNAKMGSLMYSKIQPANPFAQKQFPWQNGPSDPYRGLDGWARISRLSLKAFPEDTSGDNVTTTCSAAPQGSLALYADPGPNDLKDRSILSRKTNTNLLTVRRWELAGWKPNATAKNATLERNAKGKLVNKGAHPDFTFDGSTVLFNGWEGARGPWDCEPLSAEVGGSEEVYTNEAQYWVSH